MLYLMRKQDESIIINGDIELKVIEIKGKSVKLGFSFPKGSSVLRKELHDKIIEENKTNTSSDQSADESPQSDLSILLSKAIENNES